MKKNKLIGLTRVKDEKMMMQEHLDHMSKFCDEIWVYDDLSSDGTYEIAKKHPKVKKVIQTSKNWKPKKYGIVSDPLELGKKNQRLMDEASKKSGADWFVFMDVDEFLDEDLIKELPKMLQNQKHDAICLELYDFFITEKDKDKPYKGDLQAIRPYCGTEYRHQLFLWRNLKGLYFREGTHREPDGLKKSRTLYSHHKIKHYGKAKSIEDYKKKAKLYRKYRPQLNKSKFKFTKTAVRKDESDLGKLITWDELKKNPKLRGKLFYKFNPPEVFDSRMKYQTKALIKRMINTTKYYLIGPPKIDDSKLKPELRLDSSEQNKIIGQRDSMKKAYQRNTETITNYETRFQRPDRAMSHDKEVAIINRIFRKNKPEKILDLALGPARVSKDLNLKYFEKGFGLDSSPIMLKNAKQKLDPKKWELIEGDAFKTPFKDNEFDAVTTFRFIRHFKIDDRKRIYQEIKRILKPNGILIFEALNKDMGEYSKKASGILKPSAFEKPVYDELWDRNDLIKELNASGFNVEKLYPVLNFFKYQHNFARVFNKLSGILHVNTIKRFAKWVLRIWDIIPTKTTHQWEVIARKK
ncbi:methyltransferase domain-containing protein [Patescibacteria group bacterium]